MTKQYLFILALLSSVTSVEAKEAIFTQTAKPITLDLTGDVEATKPFGNRTPPAVKAIETGHNDIDVSNYAFVSSQYGRGIWLQTTAKSYGNISVDGIGAINGLGYICPAGHVAKALSIGEIGCSGLRATILNSNDPSKVNINYGGDITATSAAINGLTKGTGSVSIVSSGNITGYEFDVEAHGSKVYVKNNGTMNTQGTGILANNDGTNKQHNSVYVVNNGSVSSIGNSFTRLNVHKNPNGILSAISAGSVSGDSTVHVNNRGILSSLRSTGIYTYGTGNVIIRNTGSIESNNIAAFIKNTRSRVIIDQTGTIDGNIVIGGHGNNVIIRNSGQFNGQIIDKGRNNHIRMKKVSLPVNTTVASAAPSKSSRNIFALDLNLAYQLSDNTTLWLAYHGGSGYNDVRLGVTVAF